MDTTGKTTNPGELPDGLETVIGEILETEAECPGVWYVSTAGDGDYAGTEFYIVDRDAKDISKEAKAYGIKLPYFPQYLLYPADQERQTRKVIQYEIQRYRMRNGDPETDDWFSLREIALDGMEETPEYFGAYPAPTTTPYGQTVRYKSLMNGVFWIETDRCKRMLAVAGPIWEDVFSEYVMKLSVSGMENKDGFLYLFLPEKAMCLAVFELSEVYPEMRACPLIDAAALMNAVYQDYPDYALKFNLMEQMGGDSFWGWLFADVERNISVDRMIAITPDAGTDFLKI